MGGRSRARVVIRSFLLAALASLGIVLAAYLLRTGKGIQPFPASDYQGLPRIKNRELIGTNYSHFAFPNCSWAGTGVLAYYRQDDGREKVHRQLGAMRRDGIESLRTVIWHLTDASQQSWGPVPSAGGGLLEPYRSNFIDYLSEVRRYRFARLTLSFAPMWTNDPFMPNYDPAKFTENWHFIESVRKLAREYGPPDVRFDLLNEGAPSNYLSRGAIRHVTAYLRKMYSDYVRAFGDRDVTVSAIPAADPNDHGDRLQNLIDIFASTHFGQPRWYEIHIDTGPHKARYALQNSNSVLRRNGLRQPLAIGEAPYDDVGIAEVIRDFARGSRPIREILEWPKGADMRCNVSPPYRDEAYRASRQS
jgi:hypothetical protein